MFLFDNNFLRGSWFNHLVQVWLIRVNLGEGGQDTGVVFVAALALRLVLVRSITRLSLEVLFFSNFLVLRIAHGLTIAIVTVRDFSRLRVFIVLVLMSCSLFNFVIFVLGCHGRGLQFYQPAGSSWFVPILTSDNLVITLNDVSDFELFGFVVFEDELHSSLGSIDFNPSISPLLLLDLEVLRSDRLHILVLDGISQCLQLLWWTSIVFKHDKKCLSTSKWPLALAPVTIPCPVAVQAADATRSRFLCKQAVIYLLQDDESNDDQHCRL